MWISMVLLVFAMMLSVSICNLEREKSAETTFVEFERMSDAQFVNAFESYLDSKPLSPTNNDRNYAKEDAGTTCLRGWVAFGGQCYYKWNLKTRETFLVAENFCERSNAHLPTPTSPQENDFLKSMSGKRRTWLGLSEPDEEGEWVWSNGYFLLKREKSWKKGHPKTNQRKDCGVTTVDGWADIDCKAKKHIICQQDPIGVKKLKYCPTDWELSKTAGDGNMEACYWVANKEATWKEAHDDCRSKDANLVSVTSDSEFDMTSRISRWPKIWLGLTNQDSVSSGGKWVWTDGHKSQHDDFESEHQERLAKKIPPITDSAKYPIVRTSYREETWCTESTVNREYCDDRDSRWVIGHRWEDWEMWCKRNAECRDRKPTKESTAPKRCAVIDTKLKIWARIACDEKKGINYVCKKGADMGLRPADQNRNIPSRYSFNYNCSTTDEKRVLAHTECLSNWHKVAVAGSTIKNLIAGCPNFCIHRTSKAGDGSCIWDIACRRCHQISFICTQPWGRATCIKYMIANNRKSDNNRCAQYELCYPAKGVMMNIHAKCMGIYSLWEQEIFVEKIPMESMTYPCDEICSKLQLDCAWRILCKKCELLMSLMHVGRKAEFVKQFQEVMSKSNEERCTQYLAEVYPPWWVSGNWI